VPILTNESLPAEQRADQCLADYEGVIQCGRYLSTS
jgi:hypothetical protein